MTAYNNVAKNETDDDDKTIVIRALIIENINNDTADPNADIAIVPFLPNRVSIK